MKSGYCLVSHAHSTSLRLPILIGRNHLNFTGLWSYSLPSSSHWVKWSIGWVHSGQDPFAHLRFLRPVALRPHGHTWSPKLCNDVNGCKYFSKFLQCGHSCSGSSSCIIGLMDLLHFFRPAISWSIFKWYWQPHFRTASSLSTQKHLSLYNRLLPTSHVAGRCGLRNRYSCFHNKYGSHLSTARWNSSMDIDMNLFW